ncbi:MAG: hypothetical protein K9L82_13440 [Chromatiaceae bacterium]|nr:hypothetical protein [Chromatiaceae bacterium]MCF7994030.1 hypothetical protein [Chromatiaceae bacterium]
MRFLLSGEGPTDMGRCTIGQRCEADDFEPGPMAWLVDQIAEARLGFGSIELGLVHGLSEQGLDALAKGLKPLSLRGKKRRAETSYYYRNARALAKAAAVLGAERNDLIVAVLFRDADGTQSAGRGDWQYKWQSMLDGFAAEGFTHGVPMLPKPKSEAWLLCALKPDQPYQHCSGLEAASGNDRSPNSLKAQLAAALGYEPSASDLSHLVQCRKVDAFRITMTSFVEFRDRLERVI